MTDSLPVVSGNGTAVTSTDRAVASVGAGGAALTFGRAAAVSRPGAVQTSAEHQPAAASPESIDSSVLMVDLRVACPSVSRRASAEIAAWLASPRTQATLRAAAEQRVDSELLVIAQNDDKHRAAIERSMRHEWGASYDTKIAAMRRWLEGLPPTVSQALHEARLADFTVLFNTREGLEWAYSVATNPSTERAAAVDDQGPAQVNRLSDVDAELAELTRMMGDHRSRYWRGDDAERLQARYRELIDIRDGVA